ncbi:hypothetical protein TSAR_007297 [Trichomalopsis sarcophagae]|uniref:Uncharacterized protein n=1 Tax=Trichomalopsis sarcophagae TaxID=543379 RepID=A0A232FJ89_9HYME|nr:hypothetical protein TSAR_007297 [Trichomalopsis sarcophagae]
MAIMPIETTIAYECRFTETNIPKKIWILIQHYIFSTSIKRYLCLYVRVHGCLMCSALTFGTQTDFVTSKAIRNISFIKRNTSHLKHHGIVAYLNRLLVLPILLYCSPIRSPFTKIESHRLQSV